LADLANAEGHDARVRLDTAGRAVAAPRCHQAARRLERDSSPG